MIVDAERAIKLLSEAVGDKSDFVYNPGGQRTCAYVKDGKCSCLVGVALGLVLPIKTIARLDTVSEGRACSAFDIHRHILTVNAEASWIFNAAQSVQDQGGTWGEALQAARAAAAS